MGNKLGKQKFSAREKTPRKEPKKSGEAICSLSRSDGSTSHESSTVSHQQHVPLSLSIQPGDLSRQSSSSQSTSSPQSSSSVQSTSSPWLLPRQQSVNAQAAMDCLSPVPEAGRYDATSGTERFCLLARLLLDICNDAMRDLLRCKIRGGEVILTQKIYQKRNKLDKLKQLHDAQKKIILPPNNQIVRYNSLDYTLMYTVIRNVCPYKIEPDERKQIHWGKCPVDSDSSLLAALERIRFCRNDFFAHATSAEVDTTDFVNLWEQVEKALQKIDENLDAAVVSVCYVNEMKKMKNTSSDPKTVTLLKRMAELEKQLMDAYEMAVETDVRLEELFSIRKEFKKKIGGASKAKLFAKYYKQEDANIGQTEHYLARFVKENQFYVETRVFQHVEKFLEKNRCAVIVGQPGTGKTEIAVHLMFKYFKDFVVRKLDSPYEFKNLVDPREKHLIFIDNIFNCSDNTLKDWWTSFDFMQELVQPQDPDSDQKDSEEPEFITHVVMTTRPYALDAAREKMGKSHPLLRRKYIVDVDSTDFKLKDMEKKDILTKKIEYANHVKKIPGYNFNEDDWKAIFQSSPPFGFPLCARLFACDEENRKDGKAFFSSPHRHLKNRLKEIIEDDTTRRIEILFILLLVSEIQGCTLNFRDDNHCWEILVELGIPEELSLRKEMVKNLPDAAKDLREVYLRESESDGYRFIHPSVHEAVENYFIERYPNKAIEILPVHILFQKMHMEDSADECVPSLDPRFHDRLALRLLKEILEGNMLEVLNYKELKHKNFSDVFLNQILKDEHTLGELLKQKHADGLPFMYWFTSSVGHDTVIKLLKHETVSTVCKGSESELFGHYAHSLIASCASEEKLEVTSFILDHYPDKSIQNFCGKSSLPEESNENFASPLLEASRARNKDAIQLLIKRNALFSQTSWRGWPFLHVCWNEPQICCPEVLECILAFDRQGCLSDNNETTDVLMYDHIQASGEKTFFEDVVFKIDECVKKHDSFQMILLHLIQIPTLEITDVLIEAFCSLPIFERISDEKWQNPLNIVDDDENNILHLFLKNRVYHTSTIQSSDVDDSIHCEDDAESSNDEKPMYPEEVTTENLQEFAYERIENKNVLLQTIGRLCDKGLDINMKNKKGETPLMIEMSKFDPSVDIIKTLLHYRANPSAQDKFGRTCLHILLLQNYDENVAIENILAVLIKYGANVNVKDVFGNNPLFAELKRQKPRELILNCLIDAQIDMSAQDENGKTALHVAISSSYDSDVAKEGVLKILLKSKSLKVLSPDETGVSAYRLALEDLQYHSCILTAIAQHDSCSFPLHRCINENVDEKIKIQVLQTLCLSDDEKLSISATDEDRQTLLIVAARVCPEMDRLFEFLLASDIDINAKDVHGHSALLYLVESNVEYELRESAFDLLLAKEPSINEKNEDANSRSPLSRAMQSIITRSDIHEIVDPHVFPSEAITKKVLDKSPYEKSANNLQSDGAFDLKIDVVQKMLAIATEGLNLNFPVDEKGRTYLHYCTSSRLADKHTHAICKRLTELNVEVDRIDKDGLTCIDMAFRYSGKKFETIVFLLEKSTLKKLDIDRLLEHLADGNFLYVGLIQYLIQNVFDRIVPKRNLFHYLASIGYDPKDQAKAERENVFDHLKEFFRLDKENEHGQIPLHIAAEGNASVSCVRNFVRISSEFLNKCDSEKNTALHLVLKSKRDDNDVLAVVKKMLKFGVDVNAQNKMLKTPLMVAVKCAKDRSGTISELLQQKPDLALKDRLGFTILHYCMDAPKDDYKAHAVLSLFLDSKLSVPINAITGKGLTALNLAAKNHRHSRILCILKMLQNRGCSAETVDDSGQSPLYNTAIALRGMNPLITLERLIRAYVFLNHGDSDFETDKGDKVSSVCEKSKFISLRALLDTDITNPVEVYTIIKPAWLDVSSRPLNFDRNEYEQPMEFSEEFMDEDMKSLIRDSLLYLSHRELDKLTKEELVDDESTLSSVPDLEH